jgi:hypothetical protein
MVESRLVVVQEEAGAEEGPYRAPVMSMQGGTVAMARSWRSFRLVPVRLAWTENHRLIPSMPYSGRRVNRGHLRRS